MADSKIQKTGGLLDQWMLLSEIIADKRTRKTHIQVAQIVIDRQKHEHGNGRASVRYIERATGLSKWRIGKSTAELAEWGYFTRRPGIGTRPSEFTPVSWPSVRVQRDTSELVLVSESGGTGCPSPEGHYEPLVSESGGTNPAYVDGLQAGLREAESSVGAATPPHAAGLSAASGETPPGRESAPNSPADSFTELWNAFNLKLTNTKPKAKAAYEKLSPDAGLHAAMVEAAARLHAHYEEHATERRYRIQCHNWINARGWEDDLPIVYADAKGAAISKTRGSAKPTPGKPATGKAAKPGCAFPAGETCITITESILSETHTSGMLIITGNDEAGEEYIHTVPVKHHKEEVQNAGQKEKDSIVTAAGFFFQIDDPANLIGRRIVALVDGGELTWHEPSGGQPEPEPELVEPPPPKRRMTIEEQQAEYDAWFEAQLEDKAA